MGYNESNKKFMNSGFGVSLKREEMGEIEKPKIWKMPIAVRVAEIEWDSTSKFDVNITNKTPDPSPAK